MINNNVVRNLNLTTAIFKSARGVFGLTKGKAYYYTTGIIKSDSFIKNSTNSTNSRNSTNSSNFSNKLSHNNNNINNNFKNNKLPCKHFSSSHKSIYSYKSPNPNHNKPVTPENILEYGYPESRCTYNYL